MFYFFEIEYENLIIDVKKYNYPPEYKETAALAVIKQAEFMMSEQIVMETKD